MKCERMSRKDSKVPIVREGGEFTLPLLTNYALSPNHVRGLDCCGFLPTQDSEILY